MICVFAFWNCASLPFDVAFRPLSLESQANLAFNLFIDVMFALDLLLNFRTSIVNEISGEEILKGKEIAKSYLKGMFLPDLLSTIPFDSLVRVSSSGGSTFTSTEFLSLFSMLKLLRLFRFTRIISYLNTTQDIKLSLKLFKLIFYLLIYLHWQACAWFYYTAYDKSWFPQVDLIKKDYTFYEHGIVFTYCFSVWHSVSILDGADMVPATAHQALVVSFLVFFSEFIHAHILGTIGVVLHSLARKSTVL